jgi:hypothetical protein
VGDRRIQVQFLLATQGENGFEALVPVQRPIPVALVNEGPAIRQPQRGILIRAIANEVEVFAVGDES